MYARSIFNEMVNRDYDGEITTVGSILNMLNFDKLSEKTYSGSNLSVDDITENNSQLVIDQYKSFYFKIRTIDKFVSYIKDPKSPLVEQKANEGAKNIDVFVLGKYAKVAAGNGSCFPDPACSGREKVIQSFFPKAPRLRALAGFTFPANRKYLEG
jgi:hypothetical protein